MIKIISKKKYENLIEEIEMLRNKLYDFELAKSKYTKYSKLYLDELQKRLELAEMVRRLENEKRNKTNGIPSNAGRI